MATLTHDAEYACAFELKLQDWERYSPNEDTDIKTVPSGEPYTLWVKYRMDLRVGDSILYKSAKETTLVLEDIKRLIEELQQLADGSKDEVAFDPIEPDFGLVIRRLSESEASVMISSAAKIRCRVLNNATNRSSARSLVFDVDVWIDFPNQVSRFYGGYGPGLYFWVDASDIERFAFQLGVELHAIGAFLHHGEVKGKGLLQDEEIKRIILDLPIDILYAGVVGSSVVREGKDVDVVVIAERDEKPMLFHEGRISVLTLGREWLTYKKHEEMPTGLVPSILFKSIQLSLPVYGDKDEILKQLPEIRVREADFTNVEIKKKRYEQRDRKNYLVALIFEKLLKSGSIGEFEFDGVRLARKIGLKEIAEELKNLY